MADVAAARTCVTPAGVLQLLLMRLLPLLLLYTYLPKALFWLALQSIV
jgi:hypothetical protein